MHHRRLIKFGSAKGRTVICQRCSNTWLHESKGRPHALCASCRETHAACTICRQVKSHAEFYPERTVEGRVSSRCRACAAMFSRTRNARPRPKEESERHRLRRRYGITPERRAEMEVEQDGRCGICMEQTRLVIDHCHDSKAVRRLLCRKCNTGLGMFRDDVQLLERAVAYLDAHRAVT